MLATLEDDIAELAALDKEIDVLFDSQLNTYQVQWRLWCAKHYGSDYTPKPRIHTGILRMDGETPQEFRRRYKRETMRIYRQRKRLPKQDISREHPIIDTASRFMGVCFDKHSRKWRARVQINKERLHLGLYPTQEAAAKAREEALAKLTAKQEQAA